MHLVRLSLLLFFTCNLLANESPDQENAENPLSHLDPGIAVIKADQNNKLPESFCSFILETTPQEVKDKITLLKDPYCPRWLLPRKLLLYGPSGSGKTTLAQVIAQEINRPFIYISAGLLGNEYKNSVAQNLRRAIEPYKDTLCVVIIDEIDCILKKATNEKDLDQNTPKQVWEIIDLCAQLPNVLVIGITNDVRGMDEPLQTRFAGDTIEIPLLNSLEMRKKAILFHLQAFMYDLKDSYISALAKKTRKFSHRELEKLVIAAMASAYLKKNFAPIVCKDDFEKAYKQMEKSRSLLNKINWTDYEKHLQYGLQIAGLVVNVASLITNWRISWLSYCLNKETNIKTQENHRENIWSGWEHAQASQDQSENHLLKSIESNTQLAKEARDHAEMLSEKNMLVSVWLAQKTIEANVKNTNQSIANSNSVIQQQIGAQNGRNFNNDMQWLFSSTPHSDPVAAARARKGI